MGSSRAQIQFMYNGKSVLWHEWYCVFHAIKETWHVSYETKPNQSFYYTIIYILCIEQCFCDLIKRRVGVT